MPVLVRVCFFCKEDGELTPAVATYTAKGDGRDYDVCEKHLVMLKGPPKIPYRMLTEDEITQEVT
jgi:hypothetical protein